MDISITLEALYALAVDYMSYDRYCWAARASEDKNKACVWVRAAIKVKTKALIAHDRILCGQLVIGR